MKTQRTLRPLLSLLAATLLAATAADAKPRIIWTQSSLTSVEAGPGKRVFLGTDASGNASTLLTASVFSVNQNTGGRTLLTQRNGVSFISAFAPRALTFSPNSKMLFAVFETPGQLFAFSSDSGRTLWSLNLQSETFIGEIALTKEGNIILPLQGRGVALLNRNNGRAKWFRTDLNVLSPDAPAVGPGGTLFVHSATLSNSGSRPASVFGLDSHNGKIKWDFPTGVNVPLSQPILGPRGLVFVSGDGLFALKSSSGREVWRQGQGNFGKPVATSDMVIVPQTRQLLGFRASNGRAKWTRSIDFATSEAVFDGGKLILLGTGRQLQAFDAKSGRLRWTVQTPGVVRDITLKGDFYFCALGDAATGPISGAVALED